MARTRSSRKPIRPRESTLLLSLEDKLLEMVRSFHFQVYNIKGNNLI
jgi:hypothetical protein